MQNPHIQSQQASHQQYDEDILVVKRSLLFSQEQAWQGINPTTQSFQDIITNHGIFMPRCHAETNPEYKQIIPYMIFMFEKKIFIMQRKNTASEQRLANKMSLGIGGHIRSEDVTNNDIIDWAKREFEEEVFYSGSQAITTIGILNDDSSEVGRVHLGILMLIDANTDRIAIKDEHKSGVLLTRDECIALRPQMESWSQIAFDFLLEQKIL